MFKFYLGELDLKQEQVQRIAEMLALTLSAEYAKNDPEWFARFVEQSLYWFDDPSKMKNPITILIANGFMHGVHPGTSRFLGAYLAGADTIPTLAVSHTDPSTPATLKKYLKNYEETKDVFFNTNWPCPNSFQPLSRDDVATNEDWLEKESVSDVTARIVWNKHPNIQWIDSSGTVVFKKVVDASAELETVEIANFREFWNSLTKMARS